MSRSTAIAVVQSVFDLPPPERVKRFRELARESREAADVHVVLEYRESFLKTAQLWDRMARELEAKISAGKSNPAAVGERRG